MAYLEAANVQQHVFRFTSTVAAHANVRPPGVKSIQIFGAFDTAPVTDSDFELLGSTTRMNATLNFPISDAGKTIWYRFRYLNTKDQPGPWSTSHQSCPRKRRHVTQDIRFVALNSVSRYNVAQEAKMNVNTESILALPTAVKLELIGLIWDNLSESESELPKAVELEAARRRDEMLADPNLGLSHDEVWAKITKRNG